MRAYVQKVKSVEPRMKPNALLIVIDRMYYFFITFSVRMVPSLMYLRTM